MIKLFKDAFKENKILVTNLGSNHAATLVGKKDGKYIFKDSYERQPTSQLPEKMSEKESRIFGCRFGWWIQFKNVSLK